MTESCRTKMARPVVTLTLAEVQSALGGELVGDGTVAISGIAPLADAQVGQISFLSQRKYAPLLATTQASALILPLEAAGHYPRAHILTKNPYLYFARVSQLLSAIAKKLRALLQSSANPAAPDKNKS